MSIAKASCDGLWILANPQKIKSAMNDVIDLCIPFELLSISEGDTMEFFFTTAVNGVKESFIPQDSFLVMERPI